MKRSTRIMATPGRPVLTLHLRPACRAFSSTSPSRPTPQRNVPFHVWILAISVAVVGVLTAVVAHG